MHKVSTKLPATASWRVRLEVLAVSIVCAGVLLALPMGALVRPVNVSLVEMENAGTSNNAVTIGVMIDAPVPILGVQVDLSYDPSECRIVSIKEAGFFRFDKAEPLGLTFFHPGIHDEETGVVEAMASCRLFGEPLAKRGTNSFATVTIESVRTGTSCDASSLSIDSMMVVDEDGLVIVATGVYADQYMYRVPLDEPS